MFKKIFIIASFVLVFCSMADADSLSEPLSVNIESVDSKNKTLTLPAYDLKVGETGFVLTKLSDYMVISAKLEVESIKDGVATASFSDFDGMKQKYLPTPRIQPKAGDMASFRELNNKAFLIAPDLNTYEKIKTQFKDDVDFMSSDLLMGYLNDYGGFDPSVKFLKKVCSIYSVGLLYIVTTGHINILDCQSLVSLESLPFDTSSVTKTIAPFFSRLQEVKTGSLASLFRSKKSRNYFKFYDDLVKDAPMTNKKTKKTKSKTSHKTEQIQDNQD